MCHHQTDDLEKKPPLQNSFEYMMKESIADCVASIRIKKDKINGKLIIKKALIELKKDMTIIGFSKSIALELGSRNIRSNVIAPGFIETEMTASLPEDVVEGWRNGIPLKRGGTPEDIANACVFLASDLSNYITGQVLNVDGGMLT